MISFANDCGVYDKVIKKQRRRASLWSNERLANLSDRVCKFVFFLSLSLSFSCFLHTRIPFYQDEPSVVVIRTDYEITPACRSLKTN